MEYRNPSQKNSKGHIVLSHHFIKLLQWIMLNETALLQKLVNKSLVNIVEKHNLVLQDDTSKQDEEFQKTIIDFLNTIDSMISLNVDEYKTARVLQRQCISVINKIDSMVVKDDVVQHSIGKVVLADAELTTAHQMKERMLQELLKQWKPAKKIVH